MSQSATGPLASYHLQFQSRLVIGLIASCQPQSLSRLATGLLALCQLLFLSQLAIVLQAFRLPLSLHVKATCHPTPCCQLHRAPAAQRHRASVAQYHRAARLVWLAVGDLADSYTWFSIGSLVNSCRQSAVPAVSIGNSCSTGTSISSVSVLHLLPAPVLQLPQSLSCSHL